MTVRHMRIFLAVYRCGGITSAAQQLHMTQPAVTRAIQELESYYGVKLFERMGRRLPVTEVGKRFYSQAVHIVDLFDNMETSLRNWDALGVLRVGATIMLGNMLLPDLILRFKKDHPGIRVQVMIENGESLCRALLDNELDLALIEGGVEEADLTEEVFARDELVLTLRTRTETYALLLSESAVGSLRMRYPSTERLKSNTIDIEETAMIIPAIMSKRVLNRLSGSVYVAIKSSFLPMCAAYTASAAKLKEAARTKNIAAKINLSALVSDLLNILNPRAANKPIVMPPNAGIIPRYAYSI